MRGATDRRDGVDRRRFNFNPRAPCGARPCRAQWYIGRRRFQSTRPMRGATACFSRWKRSRKNFNPRAPCGARRSLDRDLCNSMPFQSTRPMRGATLIDGMTYEQIAISIHAPHAGRDSKSIQNYFTHFCDKKQFLDNFTQNAAFQSVLPLADRQKLLYLRCEPLRKFLRAFASHYKIIGSSGR